ncbi:unnamed protein product [Protopolystoma xenopodis]|uniref:Uncharacterized protein n=1 Tax=Protopolystoma xenopodis TaxID=117903 RepID=A0A448WDB2_9PLAT|nr:unnamed protein product [Protopolystoma xenopodis]
MLAAGLTSRSPHSHRPVRLLCSPDLFSEHLLSAPHYPPGRAGSHIYIIARLTHASTRVGQSAIWVCPTTHLRLSCSLAPSSPSSPWRVAGFVV